MSDPCRYRQSFLCLVLSCTCFCMPTTNIAEKEGQHCHVWSLNEVWQLYSSLTYLTSVPNQLVLPFGRCRSASSCLVSVLNSTMQPASSVSCAAVTATAHVRMSLDLQRGLLLVCCMLPMFSGVTYALLLLTFDRSQLPFFGWKGCAESESPDQRCYKVNWWVAGPDENDSHPQSCALRSQQLCWRPQHQSRGWLYAISEQRQQRERSGYGVGW